VKNRKRKLIKRMLIIGLSLAGVFMAAVLAYMQHPKFGRLPRGERLARIQKSPHYKDGRFQNTVPTPGLAEDADTFALYKEFFFGDKSKRTPPAPLPSVKSDLRSLDAGKDALVWFGHSSYFLQIGGKRMLVDPVFSGAASPVSFTTRAFAGSDSHAADDMPGIDYLFITHDHWDHLDYETVGKLKPKVGKIICGLGVGEHLEYWGFDRSRIIELDWGEKCLPDDGVTVHCFTARHFSGRAFSRDRSLWASFLVTVRNPAGSPEKGDSPNEKTLPAPSATSETGRHGDQLSQTHGDHPAHSHGDQPSQGQNAGERRGYTFYIGGDSGYGAHFAGIGEKSGAIDLAILENGQYDRNWKYIHMMPEEVLRAADDLKARRLLPVHSAKFSISYHAWDDPLRRLSEAHRAAGSKIILLTPRIGEVVDLHDESREFPRWWESVGTESP
jgi:L-ascorbate metabolism protein UlaG (beta-lactamase superfamily)